jgi:hypothetical protein
MLRPILVGHVTAVRKPYFSQGKPSTPARRAWQAYACNGMRACVGSGRRLPCRSALYAAGKRQGRACSVRTAACGIQAHIPRSRTATGLPIHEEMPRTPVPTRSASTSSPSDRQGVDGDKSRKSVIPILVDQAGIEPATPPMRTECSTGELQARSLVDPVGIEPTAFRMPSGRSTPELRARTLNSWWTQGGSNSQPRQCHRRTLPTELWAHMAWSSNHA